MTPKEKAIELMDRFEPYVIRYTQDDVVGYLPEETPILEYQKQCALIAVDELIEEACFTDAYIKSVFFTDGYYDKQDYWQEVKQEIEKL